MRKWWFLNKAFNVIFKVKNIQQLDDEEVEMYVCSLCNSIYLNKQSYITHYKVDSCTAHMYILPNDPLHIKDRL